MQSAIATSATGSPGGSAFGDVPWTPRDLGIAFLWFLGVFFIPSFVVAVPLVIAVGRHSPSLYAGLAVVGMFSYAGFAYIAWRFSAGKYGGGLAALGLRRPTWKTVRWGVAALVAAFAVGWAYQGFIYGLDIDSLKQGCADQIPLDARENRVALALLAFSVVVFAPAVEELYFRGFVLPALVRPMGIALAILVSGSAFGLVHLLGSPVLYKSLVHFVAIGAVFGFAYWKSGNLLSTIGAHFIFNLIGVISIAATTCQR